MKAWAVTDEELIRQALAVLRKELGLIEAMRLYRLFGLCSGNYTEDRHQWLDNVTSDGEDRAPVKSVPAPAESP